MEELTIEGLMASVHREPTRAETLDYQGRCSEEAAVHVIVAERLVQTINWDDQPLQIRAVLTHNGNWALLPGLDYQPAIGERLDYERFAPIGVGSTLRAAVERWEANVAAVD